MGYIKLDRRQRVYVTGLDREKEKEINLDYMFLGVVAFIMFIACIFIACMVALGNYVPNLNVISISHCTTSYYPYIPNTINIVRICTNTTARVWIDAKNLTNYTSLIMGK